MVLVYTLHLRVTSYPDKTFYSQCILSVIHGLSRIGTILLQEGEWPLCKMQHPCTYTSIQIHLAPCRISMLWRAFHEFANLVIRFHQTKYLLPDPVIDSKSFSALIHPIEEIESICKVEEAAKEQFGIIAMRRLGLVSCCHWESITWICSLMRGGGGLSWSTIAAHIAWTRRALWSWILFYVPLHLIDFVSLGDKRSRRRDAC